MHGIFVHIETIWYDCQKAPGHWIQLRSNRHRNASLSSSNKALDALEDFLYHLALHHIQYIWAVVDRFWILFFHFVQYLNLKYAFFHYFNIILRKLKNANKFLSMIFSESKLSALTIWVSKCLPTSANIWAASFGLGFLSFSAINPKIFF